MRLLYPTSVETRCHYLQLQVSIAQVQYLLHLLNREQTSIRTSRQVQEASQAAVNEFAKCNQKLLAACGTQYGTSTSTSTGTVSPSHFWFNILAPAPTYNKKISRLIDLCMVVCFIPLLRFLTTVTVFAFDNRGVHFPILLQQLLLHHSFRLAIDYRYR